MTGRGTDNCWRIGACFLVDGESRRKILESFKSLARPFFFFADDELDSFVCFLVDGVEEELGRELPFCLASGEIVFP